MKHRRLTVDPLEERTLLSVTPADWDDVLVNQNPSTALQVTIEGQSLAIDHDGDFVVAWTRYDPVLDGNGQPVVNPATGEPMLDANIYARYFTDEVQRLTLPDALAPDPANDADDIAGSFSLIYGGNEIQKISITATYQPYSFGQPSIAGSVTFGFDVNGNGFVDAGETTTVFFDEGSQAFTEIASNFQTAFQGLGGALADVTVRGISPHEYLVEFGDLSLGEDQPEITVESVNFTSGFLPAILMSTVREPVEIGPIYVSETDAFQTANAIEQYALLTTDDFLMGPVEFPPDDPSRIDWPEADQDYPELLRTAVPGLTVRPVWVLDPIDNTVKPSTTQFDITFDGGTFPGEGASGKKDQPLLVVSGVWDEEGKNWRDDNNDDVKDPGEPLYTELTDVETLKEPSPEFRVNPPEPDNPFTPLPDRFNQTKPDVAMDADGEFVITWESVVPDVVEFGTVSDVFARRFAPVGTVDPGAEQFYVDMDFDGVEETAIQGVKALDAGFRVNTTTTGAQGEPAVGMDDDGNFVIAWGSGTEGFTRVLPGQDFGYFNGIHAQRFHRDGSTLDDEFPVNNELTSIHFDPYVALSQDGNFIITWTTTDDENFLNEPFDPRVVTTEWRVFDAAGATLIPQGTLGGGGGAAAAFDDGNNFIITWDVAADSDNVGATSEGVRGVMYELFDAAGNVSGRQIRSLFRANSANFSPTANTIWPGAQEGAEPGVDADGDLVIGYVGTGPEVSEDTNYFPATDQRRMDVYRQALIDRFYRPENADLLQFFDPAVESFPLNPFPGSSFWFFDALGSFVSLGSTNEIDTDIENLLIRAMKETSPPASNEQLGRIRALIDEVAGLLRGDAWGAMFSSFDTDPDLGPLNRLNSDSLANNYRDGHNQRFIITVPTTSTGGNFLVRLSNIYTPGTESVQITPTYNNQVLNVSQTAWDIESALEGALRTGDFWSPHPRSDSPFEGPVEVRVVSEGFGFISSEILAKEGTPWDYDNAPYFFFPDAVTDLADEAVYEVTFQGEVHDSPFFVSLQQNRLQPGGVEDPKIFQYQYGDTGTREMNSSIGMEQDGDFVMAWTRDEEYTWGGVSNQNIYYRRFSEATDTAGPQTTGLTVHSEYVPLLDGESAVGPVSHVVLAFDEPLLMFGDDGALNLDNYRLYANGIEVVGGIAAVQFGLSKAADLAGEIDPATGFPYDVSPIATNKWEAVITLDGDPLTPGVQALRAGTYTIEALAPILPTPTSSGESGLRDEVGNALSFSGYLPVNEDTNRNGVLDSGEDANNNGVLDSQNLAQTFVVTSSAIGDDRPVEASGSPVNGRTYPESAQAVAVDADGDHVVVWTATETSTSRDRVWVRLYEKDGTPAVVGGSQVPAFEVTAGDSNQSEFLFDHQRYATVAIDADGDFVVTWTNYEVAADGTIDDADIYARRFAANGNPLGDSFRVNAFGAADLDPDDPTRTHQKWSSVAMDVDGDFVIAWASYAQEQNGQLGTGYGIYARKYNAQIDRVGGQVVPPRAATPEFRVNTTIAGHQQTPSVDMDAHGNFLIAWTSDQGGMGDDIIARVFTSQGAPVPLNPAIGITGWQAGEILVNTTTDGEQRYPNVSMSMPGDAFVVSWSSSGQDGSGWGVYARTFSIQTSAFDPFVGVVDAASGEFLVNTTTQASQSFSAVGMDHQGDFVVVWSGFGNQFNEEDDSGSGVFYQRFSAGAIRDGQETRINQDIEGNQWLPSVDTDGEGNFVAVWTGVGQTQSTTAVYSFVSAELQAVLDDDGPIVTDVFRHDTGERVFPGAVLETATIDKLIFAFGEGLSIAGGAGGFDSVLNLGNWSLEKDGGEIIGGIVDITFERDTITRKYVATLTFDNNGPSPGGIGEPLLPGAYVLTAHSGITDGLSELDGDYDGVPGADPAQGYVLEFFIRDEPTFGPEFRINEETRYLQHVSPALGAGFAREENNRAVAVDHDGDFVVVWTSYGQDDPSDPAGAGVYYRMYDRDNNPLTPETPVNTTVTGDQRNASVAIDADGDFVIVWEAKNVDTAAGTVGDHPDESWGVYARRFKATGQPDGDEFLVNTETLGDQTNPAVAMDSFGNFIVTYVHTHGQPFSYFHDVRVQRYNRRGERVGGEFQANSQDIPGVPGLGRLPSGAGGTEVNPQVALDDDGNFVVVWELISTQNDGAWLDTLIVGRLFDPGAQPRVNAWTGDTLEFQISPDTITNQPTPAFGNFSSDPEHREHQSPVDENAPTDLNRTARNPQVVMDDQGNFTVVWESFQDNDIDEDTDANFDNPSRDVDDWPDSYGIYLRQFTSNGSPRTYINANMVNTVGPPASTPPDPNFAYAQVNASVAVDVDGEFAVVWNGNGAEPDPLYSDQNPLTANHDPDGIFIRHFLPNGDRVSQQKRVNYTEGGEQRFPSVAMEPDGDSVVVWGGAGVGDLDGIFARRVDEPVDSAGPRTFELWQLLPDGRLLLSDGTEDLQSPQRFVVVFDEDMWLEGDDSVENLLNWMITAEGEELVNVIDTISFGLNETYENYRNEYPDPSLIAKTNKYEAVITLIEPLPGGDNYELIARTPIPSQAQSGLRDAVGNPLARTGLDPNGVNQVHTFSVEEVEDPGVGPGPREDTPVWPGVTYPGGQRAVATDADGDHVVVFTGLDGLVYVAMYDPDGSPAPVMFPPGATEPTPFWVLEGDTNAGSFTGDWQQYATVAADADGDFVVTWTNYRGDDADIYARRFRADGTPQDDAFRVNVFGRGDLDPSDRTRTDQKWSVVAVEPDGDFIITWSSYSQEDDGQLGTGYGVYARRYDTFGQPLSPEFRVNVTTEGDQKHSSVAVDAMGGFVITWVSDQNGVGEDIIARTYWPDGSPQPFGGTTGYLFGEFLVNQTTDGNQTLPDVAMRPDGTSYVITWTGPDGSLDGVFGREFERIIDPNEPPRAIFVADLPPTGILIPHATNPPISDPLLPPPVTSTIDVTASFNIADLDVRVDIQHPRVSDLILTLTSPTGITITLAQRVPRDPNVSPPELLGADMQGTIFDDEALVSISQYPAARPPFTGRFIPDPDALSTFDGTQVQGTWTLTIYDARRGPFEPKADPDDPDVPLLAFLYGWSLDVGIGTRATNEFGVSTSVGGTQAYSSVAMTATGDYAVVWSGPGDQPDEQDLSQNGIFFQRFGVGGAQIGTETRVNRQVEGNQWLASVDADSDGNFVVAWTGPSTEIPQTETVVYKFASLEEAAIRDTHGPTVTDVVVPGGDRLLDGGVVGPLNELTVVFSEDLSLREIDVPGVGRADYEMILPKMPVENGGGIRDGEWFTVQDQSGVAVTFEFDTGDGEISPNSDVQISIDPDPNTGDTRADVAQKIDAAVGGSVLTGVTVRTLSDGDVSVLLEQTSDVSQTTGATIRLNRMLDYEFIVPWMPIEDGPGIVDGERFTVKSVQGAQVAFEFDVTGDGILDPAGDVEIDIFPLDTRLTVAQRIAAAVNDSDLIEVEAEVVDEDVVAVVLHGPINVLQSFGARIRLRTLYDGPGPDSVLNPQNWKLELNGNEILGAVQEVSFQRGPSRRYEAVLTLDGNGLSPGTPALPEGNYVLTVYDTIQDAYSFRPGSPFFLGNSLDGDFDGVPGTKLDATGAAGYQLNFVVTTAPDQYGAEFRINEDWGPEQRFSAGWGTGYGREQSTRALAVDHDGDFVVVWTSYGQDDPSDPSGAGVYMRMFDRNNEPMKDPVTGEIIDILVNTTTQGHQRNAGVAMDADGDFVVVWEAENDNADGSWGVYGQRFNSVGERVGGEFLVNSNTQNDQLNPAVAMDVFGNFVVVWAAKGQPYSYFNDVRGQVYNYRGERISPEFRVNETNIPGTSALPGSIELNPAVAMDAIGNFVVAWDRVDVQNDGAAIDSDVLARLFDPLGVAQAPEFQVNVGDDAFVSDPEHNPKEDAGGGTEIEHHARNPQIAVDWAGNIIIAWEAFQDNDNDDAAGPDSYGIYFRRFAPDGTEEMTADHQANLVITIDDDIRTNNPALAEKSDQFAFGQVNPSVAMDADGDYVIAWNGHGAVPHPLDPMSLDVTNPDEEGVWIRNFHTQDLEGEPEFVGTQTRVNMSWGGIQQFPSVGMEPDGDKIVVWSGSGVGDRHGIFARRYDEPTDTAGPMVSDLQRPDGQRIAMGDQLTQSLSQLVVVFDEQMLATGPDSVTNPGNYLLSKDGVPVQIVSIQFGLSEQTNKWEAVLVPAEPLGTGHYEIVIRNTLRDVVGNPLNSNGLNPNGQDVVAEFDIFEMVTQDILVNETIPGDQITRVPDPDGIEHSPQAVAGDADGEYVVVWTDTTAGQEGVYAKVYDGLRWSGGGFGGGRESRWDWNDDGDTDDADTGIRQILVTDTAEAAGYLFASVARDADGDFVVTWSQNDGTEQNPDWNVWARRYDAVGTPFDDPFQVNSVTEGTQRYSTVAMDVDGDFVITWQSNDEVQDLQGRLRDGDGYGVYAQRYNPVGQPVGGTNEVQLLTFIENPVGTFRLQWDGDENPDSQNITDDIQINGNPFPIAEEIADKLNALARDAEGNQINRVEVQAVSLTEVIIVFLDEGAGKDQVQIVVGDNPAFANPVSDVIASTVVDGYRGEFLVNDTTTNDQMFPTIAMSAEGNFVITWTSYGQDGDAPQESNIYAKQFISNDAFRYAADVAGARDYAWGRIPDERRDMPLSVSTDDPINHVVNPGSGYDGIVEMTSPLGWTGSGILLRTGRHILTAAHVVDFDMLDGLPVPLPFIDIRFDMPAGPISMTATNIYIHPGYDDDVTHGNDIAIVVLPQEAPSTAERYDIYRGSGELRQVAEIVGYGMAGQGLEQFYDGNKRLVNNVFEIYGDALSGMPWADFNAGPGTIAGPPTGTVIGYDFDNGLPENDMFGELFGIRDVGIGEEEGAAAHGDSGGPAFIDGRVAGVGSFVLDYAGTDIDGIPFNISFGSAGFYVRVSAYADWIDMLIQSTGPEFLVNDVPLDPVTGLPMPTGDQKWSSVAMDADGDFAISWTSYGQDGGGGGYGGGYAGEEGVFAKRYNADTSELLDPATGLPRGEFQVNTTIDGKQQHSQMSMDADGDFVITWEGSPDRAEAGGNPTDDYGVFAQRYAANARIGLDPFLGPNGEIGGELAVNSTKAGDQRFPSIALDDTGDSVIVWAGNGELPDSDQADPQGIYQRRFESLEDDAGPTVADVVNVIEIGGTVTLEQVPEGVVLEAAPTRFLVSFGEDLVDDSPTLLDSITNPSNWILTRDGEVLRDGVSSVQFGLNQSSEGPFAILPGPTNKYEALITLDGDPDQGGDQPLAAGVYVLTIRSYVEDQFDNPLDGDYDGLPGGDFDRTFIVSTGAGGPIPDDQRIGDPDPDQEDELVNFEDFRNQDSPAVASDAEGNSVVVWVEYDEVMGLGDIMARRYDPNGDSVGGEFIVNSYRTGNQVEPDVAMDAFGNFVVTWSGEGEVNDQGDIDLVGIFARVFDAFGQPLDEQFPVNQISQASSYPQTAPSVAMDADGDFAITWTSYRQDGDLDGVYARRYNFLGEPQGDEFLVNSATLSRQANSDIAMDDDGDFVIVWAASQHPDEGSEWGISVQRYNSAGVAVGGEFIANTHVTDDQLDPHVAMDSDGDFVVTWSSYLSMGMGDESGWGVYARRFNAAGTALDAREFGVNETTLHWQYQPDVSMDAEGDFVITWTTVGQDNAFVDDKGIFARAFNADGSDYVDPDTGLRGEFQVNATVVGNQTDSAVALDADGDFAIVWVGPDDDGNGIYHRHIRVNPITGDGGTGGGGGGGFYYAGDGGGSAPTTVLRLEGTWRDDIFKVIAGPTASTSIVLVNGVEQVVEPGTSSIRFDGLGGHDKVIFVGSSDKETVQLWPDHGWFAADHYTVIVSNIEQVEATSGGGGDTVKLYDDPDGADTFKAWSSQALMLGDGFDNRVYGYRYVYGYATEGGEDSAKLYDDPNTADRLEVAPDDAEFSGEGFYSRAFNFRYVYGFATAGGGDVAVLYDDPNRADTFKAWPGQAKLYGDRFWVQANSFGYVTAVATDAGGDLAALYDSATGQDTFEATPDEAELYGESFRNRAMWFDIVRAVATPGGGDMAVFTDDPEGADAFSATPDQARLYGDGFDNLAKSFAYVRAYATEGSGDKAWLLDDPNSADTLIARPGDVKFLGDQFDYRAKSFDHVRAYATEGSGDAAAMYDDPSGLDTFYARPDQARFYYGNGYHNRAYAFDSVDAYATEGNGDEAIFVDDPAGADRFKAWPGLAMMLGSGYENQAVSFAQVTAYATEGSDDLAMLYDDPVGEDMLTAYPDWAMISGDGFEHLARSFDFLQAYATEGGRDEARLYDDPQTVDTFKAWPTQALMTGNGFDNRVYNWRYVYAFATEGGDDVARLYDSDAKDTLVAFPHKVRLYNGTYYNQARYFAQVYAYSQNAGYDTAYLYDSDREDAPDHLAADAAWASLSNELLGYAVWLTDFEEVIATQSNQSDTDDINTEALDFIFRMEQNW